MTTVTTPLGPQPPLGQRELDDEAQALIDSHLMPYADGDAAWQWEGMLRFAAICAIARSRAAARALARASTWYQRDQPDDAAYLRSQSVAIERIIDAENEREAGLSQMVSSQPGGRGTQPTEKVTEFHYDDQGRISGKTEREVRA